MEVNLRQTKIAPLPEAELIAQGIAREIIMKVIVGQLNAKLKVAVDREVREVMAVMELQEEWVDRDTEKELDALVEILKELDIESNKKEKITSKKTEQKSKNNKKISKKEILKIEAVKKSKKITQFFSKKPAAAEEVFHEPMEVDKADIAPDEDMTLCPGRSEIPFCHQD